MSVWKKFVAAVGLGAVTTTCSVVAPGLDSAPDLPEAFGYKVNWFAVRTNEPSLVVEALRLGEGAAANWKSGTRVACQHSTGGEAPRVFVSPSVRGWVFVIGASLPYPDARDHVHSTSSDLFYELFNRLAKKFSDVQFFGSHRVVSFAAWARARQGKVTRVFAYVDGEVLANVGPQSAEERQLGFADLTELSLAEAADRIFAVARQRDHEEEKLVANGMSVSEAATMIRRNVRSPIPDEQDVTQLAALWGVSPDKFPLSGSSPGTGVLIALPKAFLSQ